MPYVYSTASADTCYTSFRRVTKDLNLPVERVLVKGGSNVMDRKRLVTPLGVATKVTEEELAFLQKHPTFLRHAAKGFVKVAKTKQEPEKVAGDMTPRDKGAQLVAGDFPDNKAPKTDVNQVGRRKA